MTTPSCTNTTGTGAELCDLLDGTSQGLEQMLQAIDSPLVTFVAFLGVAAGIVAVVVGIASLVRRAGDKASPRRGRR